MTNVRCGTCTHGMRSAESLVLASLRIAAVGPNMSEECSNFCAHAAMAVGSHCSKISHHISRATLCYRST